jgi:hypothetical protein
VGWAGKVCCIHQHAAAALAAFGDDGELEWSGVGTVEVWRCKLE